MKEIQFTKFFKQIGSQLECSTQNCYWISSFIERLLRFRQRLFAKKVKIKFQPPLYRIKSENFEDDVQLSLVVYSESNTDSEEKQEVQIRRGQASDVVLMSSLLTLNIFHTFP